MGSKALLTILLAGALGFAGPSAMSQGVASAPSSQNNGAQLPALVAASDAQATTIASQALNAAGGLQALAAIQDFTATGQITYYWAGKQVQGQVTLRARGLDEFRLDANLPDGTRSWAVTRDGGNLVTPDGKETPVPVHDALTLGSLTLPGFYLALATAAPVTTVSTVGTAEVEGVTAAVIRVQRHPAASDPAGFIARLSSRDFYVDSANGLVVKTEVMTHPVDTLTISMPEDIYFSDYQRVGAVEVPFAITETISGQTIWTIQLSSVQLNSGLSDSEFVLP